MKLFILQNSEFIHLILMLFLNYNIFKIKNLIKQSNIYKIKTCIIMVIINNSSDNSDYFSFNLRFQLLREIYFFLKIF